MTDLKDNGGAILITGPTASGKSALALKLAEQQNGVVINADSMQVYDTLRVLTARPSQEDMAEVPHLLYGTVPASQSYSTGDWLRAVGQILPDLRRQERLPVFVGGTGLYFKALTGGLSEMPVIPQEVRDRLREKLLADGPEELHAELRRVDGEMAERLSPTDGQRIVRALEVMLASGRSISAFQSAKGPVLVDPEQARKIVVLPDRALLHQRIDQRFSIMLETGAVDEVRALMALNLPAEATAMRAIGVAEIATMLRGEMTREQVIERGSALTRQYAKRQMTWFRNQMDESWERFDPFAR